MKKKPITIKSILDLDKKLIVIIGRDDKLKRAIREKMLYYQAHKRRVLTNMENSLHPYEQCKMIEHLVINAQEYDSMIITNSSYFVDHLRNMMEASKKKNQDQIKEKFLLKDKRAFIKVKDVAVFDCEDGQIKNVLKRTGEIDWDTFSKIAEDLCDIYFKMEEPGYVGLQ